MTEITASMIGAGGLEAEVPGEGEDEAEVLGKEEIGAHLGKAVLREGQRLNSGIGKGNRWNLLTRMTRVTMIMTTTMALQRMENSINTLISSSTDTNMEATNTDPQVAMSGSGIPASRIEHLLFGSSPLYLYTGSLSLSAEQLYRT
ncbi:hypothetical protein U1Q18_008266 [Sarracenia purpurea var. burkii]